MLDPLDLTRLREALALAEQAIGLSDPNPRVGCIVGWADGRVLGTGFTQQAGGPHAEVMALRAAVATHGTDAVRGATAWVTLEPCAHHGRTPPCTEALVGAGLARVAVALRDPFPAVDGRGIERLRAAGIEVELIDAQASKAHAQLAEAAAELNVGFLHRVRHGRPWVRVKLAASLDGRVALPDGRSQWITGPAARADGHAWRARAGALLTGIGTVLADDPRLDVRGPQIARQPRRIVLDSRARLPASARIFSVGGDIDVVTAAGASPTEAWPQPEGRQVRQRVLPVGPDGRLDLVAMLHQLGSEGLNELHVEAGPILAGALHDAGCVDEWLLYLGPRLLGQGRAMIDSALPGSLADPAPWRLHDTCAIGDDVRIRLRRR